MKRTRSVKAKILSLTEIFLMGILINCPSVLAYPKPVAVITNHDDIEESITIIRANGEPDGADALLYPGDRITGETALIEVDCSPYTELQPDGRSYVISYNPPSGIWGVSESMCNKASSFWSNVEDVTIGASRGLDYELNLIPQPGFDVTLLPHQEVRFSWNEPANKKFFIKDSEGKIVFEKGANGVVDIVPSTISLKEGMKYTWGIEGTSIECRFSVFYDEFEKKLFSKLEKIEQENISADECILKKVKYVQLLSDIYPDTIDLYWLCLQWLRDTDVSAELQQQKQILLKRCVRHLDEEM